MNWSAKGCSCFGPAEAVMTSRRFALLSICSTPRIVASRLLQGSPNVAGANPIELLGIGLLECLKSLDLVVNAALADT